VLAAVPENAADLVAAAGPGPVTLGGEGQGQGQERERRRRRQDRRAGGAADVGHPVGRRLGHVRRRLLAARREGHQPGLLHRLGGQLSLSLSMLLGLCCSFCFFLPLISFGFFVLDFGCHHKVCDCT
jgi:hypothetical protein